MEKPPDISSTSGASSPKRLWLSKFRNSSSPIRNLHHHHHQQQQQQHDDFTTTRSPFRVLLQRLSVVALLLVGAVITVAPFQLVSVLQKQHTTIKSSTSAATTVEGNLRHYSRFLQQEEQQQQQQQKEEENITVDTDSFQLQDNNVTASTTSPSTGGGTTSPSTDTNYNNNSTQEETAYDDEFCDTYCAPSESLISSVPLAIQIIMIILLIMLSALFSGLTLGLMGLDKTGLEIVMEGEDEVSAAAAKVIYPVRVNGNLLLCTLLLGNVAVNAMLSILSAENFGGAVGFVSSTFLIVIFGEIIPQAACSRYALLIGSHTVPLVKVIMFLVYPLAKPMAFCLDKALGRELATTYSSTEMMKMLQIHVEEDVLDKDTAVAMTGALKYKDMTVSEVMTPLENTFMLSVDQKLSFETIAKIFKTGYSRIPIFEVSQNNIIGLLFVKDLIFIDPADDTPVRNFIQIFGRSVHYTWPDDKLGDVLRELRNGKSHLALVRDVVSNGDKDPYYEIRGIITLEDIIEEIIGHEIVDETDAFMDGTHQVKVDRVEGFEWAKLRLLGGDVIDEHLSYTETKAITAHLMTNYPRAVALLTESQVHRLIAETVVTVFPTATRELGKELPNDLIYEKNVPSNVCTLILSGKVTVISGDDEIRTDVSSWTLMGIGALRDPNYKPDFTAFVSDGPCRCLRITREDFTIAMDASASEKQSIKEDSFRNLAVTLKNSGHGKSNSEAASVYSETASSVASGGILKANRKSKLIAALQIASGVEDPSHNAINMLDAIDKVDSASSAAPTSLNEGCNEGIEGNPVRVSFASANGNCADKELAKGQVAEESSKAE